MKTNITQLDTGFTQKHFDFREKLSIPDDYSISLQKRLENWAQSTCQPKA